MIEFEVGQFSWTTRTFSYSLLLFYFFLTFSTTAEYDSRDVGSISNDRTQDNDFHSCTEGKCIKRTTQEISSGMWFGPRLGKRQKLESPTEMDTELDAVANALDNSRWDILALPGDKKRITGIKINQEEGDYDDDRIISKLIILEDPRKDDPFSKKSFYLSTNRGNDRVLPWTISSRFPHRTRRFSTMS
ncbi:PREDICTED: PBAN-type neuropeptides-like [Polistes dominula]|uniref:PBAN-type neuropeptides-like n=1 Tax=Polistes dominula TaxID=743375 RepID=A0ABM1JB25_POLDO|nr:PREDICTED: PBAN-type neuropeptides-like [Polistes dominula]